MALTIRSDIEMVDPSQVPLWVSGTIIDQSFQVATTTALVYHAITTLDKEAKYFWVKNTRLNVASVVYFANRYIGILGTIARLVCNFAGWTSNISFYVTLISIDYILMIRVLALYSQHKRLAYFLKALLGLEATLKLVIMTYGIIEQKNAVFSLGPDGPTVCGQKNSAPILVPLGIVDWAIPMVYGVVLMILAIYKAAEFWRLSRGFKGLNLVKVLIVDQVVYFVLAVGCCVFNIMEFKLLVSDIFLSNLLLLLGNPSFLCVLGSTMFFNLKEAGEQGLNQGTSYRVKSVSAMEFA